MATTRLIPLHINKGKTAIESMKNRIDYAQNPEKTEGGELVTGYECNPSTAWQEFMLSRNEYMENNDHKVEQKVIAYQIRQSFKPGEVTAEEANKIGMELAMRFTKGKHAFTVSTHTDRAHIHNHIIFNAVDLSSGRKFRNFFLSSYALRRLSDIICVEHGLSIIEERPRHEWQNRKQYKKEQSLRNILRFDLEDILDGKPKNLDAVIAALESQGYEIKRGKHLAVKPPKGVRFIRLKSLGEGYTEEALIASIARPTRSASGKNVPEDRISLMKNLEQTLRDKDSPGYQNWAQMFNLKEAAKTILFIQENHINTEKEFDAIVDRSVEKYRELSDKIKGYEKRLKEISELKKTIIDYSKTRLVYEAYRKAGYSKKFYEEHRAEITIHQAAKKKFDALGTKKIPRVKELSAEYAEILAEKKQTYQEYREARSEMKKNMIIQKNMAMLTGRESVPERNEQPSHEV